MTSVASAGDERPDGRLAGKVAGFGVDNLNLGATTARAPTCFASPLRRWVVPSVAEGPVDSPEQEEPNEGYEHDADWVHEHPFPLT